jgi:hypothetical protein
MSERTARRSANDGAVLAARVRKARKIRKKVRWSAGSFALVASSDFALLLGVAVVASSAVKACCTLDLSEVASLVVSKRSLPYSLG